MRMNRIIVVLLLLSAILVSGVSAANYTAKYPPAYSAVYVNATSIAGTSMYPWFAVDPTRPLTGSYIGNAWVSKDYDFGGQRFTIDLGDNYIIRNVSYDNFHSSGTITDRGSNNVTVWGSATNDSYLREPSLVYANTTGWTKIGIVGGNETGSYFFQKHVASNVVDTHYFLLDNPIGYRYYTFQIDNNHGGTEGNKGLRRITLWTEDGYVISPTASFSSNNVSIAINTTQGVWEGVVPFSMQFTNTSSSPPQTSFVWNYTESGGDPVTFNQTEYYNPIYTFEAPGNYSISLNVTGPFMSNISTQQTYVLVHPQPVANFSSFNYVGPAPFSTYFYDTSTNTIDAYARYFWDFGDGNTSTEKNLYYTYNDTGTYTVSHSVSTSGLALNWTNQTGYITVGDSPVSSPVASFYGGPQLGAPPLQVFFTDVSTNTPTSWLWDFGDGNTTGNTEQNPTHLYESSGFFTINLTATNGAGSNSSVRSNYITIY